MASPYHFPTRLTLRGADANEHDAPYSALTIKLDEGIFRDVQRASGGQGGLQLLTGNVPRIRLGKRTIDLSVSTETFRHELYTALTDSSSNLQFTGIVGHKAELNLPSRKKSLGADAALAALKSSLASYEQEKQAKQTNISDAVVAVPKNRFEAAKQAKRKGLLSSQPPISTPSTTSTPHQGPTIMSVPATEHAKRIKAMRTPLLHLLAMKPISREDILEITHIPHGDVDEILSKVADQVGGKWQLSSRGYKDLDVWEFNYKSQSDRQAAIDNAIRAFDRMRLGKDEKLWQMLLPKKERDKGIILSRLHLNAGGAIRNVTPKLAASPLQDGDTLPQDTASKSATPRLGPSLTPKSGASNTGLAKRLFAKDPQKQRAAEAAKEKKRKEREAAKVASDNEGKPVRKKQMTATSNSKIKSAEFVSGSDDESAEEGEVRESAVTVGGKVNAEVKSQKSEITTIIPTKASTKPQAGSSGSNRAALKPLPKSTGGIVSKATTTGVVTKPPAVKTARPSPAVGKSTPNGLSAPATQSRSQLSPQKPDSKPTIPSPLGAARPRVASDVSDRGAIGVQRVRQGTETPKGLGITNGARKRHDTFLDTESPAPMASTPRKANGEQKTLTGKVSKPTANGTAPRKTNLTNGDALKAESAAKRKSSDSVGHDKAAPASKHRKTESALSEQAPRSNSGGSTDDSSDRLNSARSIMDNITYNQGVNLAERFRDVLYPEYTKLYDEVEATKARGEQVPRKDWDRLWDMHHRLEEIKAQIQIASTREHDGD